MSGKIEFLKSADISKSLVDNTRQYLLGDLKKSQNLKFIFDKEIEIGITCYNVEKSEKGHYHKYATEYHMVLSGLTTYFNVDTNEEFIFKKGDFYVIRPNTKYLQKSKKGTKILFVKAPSGNDKINIDETELIINWLNSKIESKRIDHYYSKNSPFPNSIKPAVAVALIKDGKVLFVKRKDSGNWTLPGGTHEFGESLIQTGIREILEEVGYEIKIFNLIGTYTDPNILIEYNDGEVRQEFTFLYEGKIIRGDLKIDNESTDARWIDFSDILSVQMAKSQERRIQDLLDYINSGKQFFR